MNRNRVCAFLVLMLFLTSFRHGWAVKQPIPLSGQARLVGTVTPVNEKTEPAYHVLHTTVSPAITMDGDVWKKVPAMVLDRKDQSGGLWKNPDDLSGSMRMLWNEQALYFHVEVKDNVHAVPVSDAKWWQNDGIQFVMDATLNGPRGGYDIDEHNYFVSDSSKGPVMVCYFKPGQPIEGETILHDPPVTMMVRPDGVRVYEWTMAWSMLDPISPWILGQCGFSWCILDNDGEGFKSSLFWTRGVIYGQDASQFGRIVFEGAPGTRPAMLGLRPESKPRLQAKKSQWLTIDGIDPWGQARLLVSSPTSGLFEAHAAIYRQDETAPVAQGQLRLNVSPGQTAGFSWNISDLPGGWYDVVYEVPGIGRSRRMTFTHFNYDLLSDKRQELCAKYGVDRPWDAMGDAPPSVRRHRGMVATALQMLDGEDWSKAATHVALKIDGRKAYWKALVDAGDLIADLEAGKDVLAKRRGSFLWAYYSQADGCGHNFVVDLPEDYDPSKTYPLSVWLHGAGWIPQAGIPGRTIPKGYIEVSPWGRGPRGSYRALSENDVLETIRFMKQAYRIDPDRVYLGGPSMGGGGTWNVGCRHPDWFAAITPLCGSSGSAPLENLLNVPVLNTHGDQDWTVPLDLSRYAVSALLRMGYPVVHREMAGAGHDANKLDLEALPKWYLPLKRPDKPSAIVFTCQSDDDADNRAYWLTVRRMLDPHEPALVRARTIGQGKHQALSMDLTNIAVLELNTDAMPLDRKADLCIQIGFDLLHQKAPLPEKLFVVHQTGQWLLAASWSPPKSDIRPYHAGGAALLYRGEPLMIVYGTQCASERSDVLREAAESLSFWAGAGDDMPQGHIPLKADRDVTADDLHHFNLIVLGGAKDNRITADILPRLPLTINAKNELIAGGRGPVSLDGAGFRLAYYNPLAPRRMIFLVATDEDSKAARDWYKTVRRLMSGTGWIEAIDVPDLVVQTFSGLDRRRMQFTTDWQWCKVEGADQKLTKTMCTERAMNLACAQWVKQTVGADVVLWEGARSDEKRLDPNGFTLADMATTHSQEQTLLCRMTGEELLDIRKKWSTDDDLLVFPALSTNTIAPDRNYRVVLPPDLTWQLAQRKNNLHDVEAGPAWSPSILWPSVFEKSGHNLTDTESEGESSCPNRSFSSWKTQKLP